jgi:hypothetical protein
VITILPRADPGGGAPKVLDGRAIRLRRPSHEPGQGVLRARVLATPYGLAVERLVLRDTY